MFLEKPKKKLSQVAIAAYIYRSTSVYIMIKKSAISYNKMKAWIHALLKEMHARTHVPIARNVRQHTVNQIL